MTRRRTSWLASTRRDTYKAARVMGDVRAVQTGRVGRRITNRLIGRYVVSRLWRR